MVYAIEKQVEKNQTPLCKVHQVQKKDTHFEKSKKGLPRSEKKWQIWQSETHQDKDIPASSSKT